MRLWVGSSMVCAVLALGANAQQARVCVVDEAGLPLTRATVLTGSGTAAVLDANACTDVPAGSEISVTVKGFVKETLSAGPGDATERVVMHAAAAEHVTVTADRGLAGINDAASSVAVLTPEQMQAEPGLTLDDALHQVAGFQLFRRTSSWTANPTSSGVSLRGLGSTAASRTLVVSDEVPMNDPFGGWVHWDEIPQTAIRDVELVRGGSAELYGSSAIGGVIDILPVEPREARTVHVDAEASGASESTALLDGTVAGANRWVGALVAANELTTGGYITVAPAFRGAVDVPANVNSQSGRVELRTAPSNANWTAFLRGNVMNESRDNGTRLQTNAARLWRYVGGGDADIDKVHALLRLFGSREGYRQSFTSVAANRNSEALTKLQHVPTDELGFAAQLSRAFGDHVTAAAGADMRDVRATDDESPVSAGVVTSTTSISARQRELGAYVDAIWQPNAWSVSGSVRVDSFRTFDAEETGSKVRPMALPNLAEIVVSPRVGLVRKLPHGVALTGTAFRAFRGPTMNELYRTSQVGQETTIANSSLAAERATGLEAGVELTAMRADGRELGRVRTTYFWTEVNRPISAVLLSQTATTEKLQRQNLGQIRSRGLMVEAQSARWRGLDASLGYQLAVATVTAFNSSSAAQANLTGNWIPEVPRESVATAVNYRAEHVASFHLIATYEGREFDDAANRFLLHPYARFDLSAERNVTHGLSVFAGAQNLLDRAIDAGRTPTLTLAPPRLVQAGLRYTFGR